jgi:hypothetical protein
VTHAVNPRSLLPVALGVAAAAAPVGLALGAESRPAPPPPRALLAPLGPHPTLAAAMRDAGRGRLEREHVALARSYDRLTGRRTAGRAAARVRALSPARLRAANRALRAEVRTLDVPIPPVLHRIAQCESHGNPRAVGGGGAFRGALQFMRGTWEGVGGRGDPAAAPLTEQLRRGAILLRRSGSSPWPVCGR